MVFALTSRGCRHIFSGEEKTMRGMIGEAIVTAVVVAWLVAVVVNLAVLAW